MNKQVMRMYAGDYSHLDQAEIGRAVMEWYARSLEEGLAMREQLPAERFVDCSQAELADQPMQVIERIYERFEFNYSPAARTAFQAFVDNNPKGKHGRHEYDLASHGLSGAEALGRVRVYLGNERWPISA